MKKKRNCQHGISRREFLKKTAVGTAATYASLSLGNFVTDQVALAQSVDPKFKVYEIHNPSMTDSGSAGSWSAQESKVNLEPVRESVEQGIKCLTGISNIQSAWASLFSPDTNFSNKRIGIKTNMLCGATLMPHSHLIRVILEGLVSIGFAKSNIWIYDYHKNHGHTGPLVGKLGSTWSQVHIDEEQWGPNSYSISGEPSTRLIDLLDEGPNNDGHTMDYLINVFVPKTHWSEPLGGITLSFKNHYGTFAAREGNLETGHCRGDSRNYCWRINAHNKILGKQKLIICDALWGSPYGGARSCAGITRLNRLVFGTEGVSLDYLVAWNIMQGLMNINGDGNSEYDVNWSNLRGFAGDGSFGITSSQLEAIKTSYYITDCSVTPDTTPPKAPTGLIISG